MRHQRALIFLWILLAAFLLVLLKIAWPFLTPLLLATVLATVISPLNNRLRRRVQHPGRSAILTTLATVTLLGALLICAGMTLSRELANAYTVLNQRSLEEGGWPALITHTADRIVDKIATRVPVDKERIRSELVTMMKNSTGFILNHVGAALGGFASLVVTCVLVAFFLYFLLRYGDEWLRWLASIIPLDPAVTANLFRVAQQSIVANVNGVIAVGLAQGLALSLGFWFLGFPSPMLWGLLGAIASVIPVIGSSLIWVPIAIVFLVTGAYWKALLLCVWGGLAVGSIDNVLRPLVVGVRQKLHPVLIGLSMIGGTYAFGPLGILIGPVLISLTFATGEEIRKLVANDVSVQSKS